MQDNKKYQETGMRNKLIVLDKDKMKSEVLPIRLWQNMAVPQKGNLDGVLSTHSLQVESVFPVAHNEEKGLLYVSYVLMSKWTYLCKNMKDEHCRGEETHF